MDNSRQTLHQRLIQEKELHESSWLNLRNRLMECGFNGTVIKVVEKAFNQLKRVSRPPHF